MAKSEYKVDELAEAAWLAFNRRMYGPEVDPPEWRSLNQKRRKAWGAAALAIAGLVNPLSAPNESEGEVK